MINQQSKSEVPMISEINFLLSLRINILFANIKIKTSIETHISYININYKHFAGDCFEMSSSAVQLNLRSLRHSAWGERIYLRFIPGKRHFCVDCLARFAVSKAVFSVDIRQESHRRHRLRQRLYIRACRGQG